MFFSKSRGLAPKESLTQTLQVPKVVRRRQVRIGIRGRIVTVEVRQARIVTVVSIAGAKDGAKAATYRHRVQTRLKGCQRYTKNTMDVKRKYKKPPSAVLLNPPMVVLENSISKSVPVPRHRFHARPLHGLRRVPVVAFISGGLCGYLNPARIEILRAFAERRRQARIGIRGRIVTVEERQARKVTGRRHRRSQGRRESRMWRYHDRHRHSDRSNQSRQVLKVRRQDRCN